MGISQAAIAALHRSIQRIILAGLVVVIGQNDAVRAQLPKPDHVVIVIEENKGYHQIIGSANAPYINTLASQGASFSRFFALHHPSQPNYLEIFSGSNQGVRDDKCPLRPITAASLAGELSRAHLSFRGYAEDLPRAGALDVFYPPQSPTYARKHCPWIDFADVDPGSSLPLKQFPAKLDELPTIALVIPNLFHDMHNGKDPQRIRAGDRWLKEHLDAYVQWSKAHNSLLIITWDEDNHFWWNRTPNQIPTILVGPMVKPGIYPRAYNHLDLLRTVAAMYSLPLLGKSKFAKVIAEPWVVPGK